ncbi:MAG: prepilin peptidase [Terriglobia bacterium]
MNLIVSIAVVACVAVAAFIDVRESRIPNWLTLSSASLAIVLNFLHLGIQGLVWSVLGIATGFSLLFLLYLLGGMGAGDVKLLGTVGAFVGPKLVFYTFIWMALIGGVMALILILYKRAFAQTLQNLKFLLLGWILRTSTSEATLTIRNQSLLKLPYGVAIALGAIMAVCFQNIPGVAFQSGSMRLIWMK